MRWSISYSISCNFHSVEIDDGARGIVEMLFCTSLIALVGAADQPSSSPRKLQIVNTKVCCRHPVRRSPYSSYCTAASIYDLRASLPFIYSRRQNEPKDTGHRSGG